MKAARRYYLTHRSVDPQMAECTYTVSGTRAVGSHPPVMRARLIIDDNDDKRAALKIEGTPDEFVTLAFAILDTAWDASTGSDQMKGLRGIVATALNDYRRAKGSR